MIKHQIKIVSIAEGECREGYNLENRNPSRVYFFPLWKNNAYTFQNTEAWVKDPLLNIDDTIKQQVMQDDNNKRRIIRPVDATK